MNHKIVENKTVSLERETQKRESKCLSRYSCDKSDKRSKVRKSKESCFVHYYACTKQKPFTISTGVPNKHTFLKDF